MKRVAYLNCLEPDYVYNLYSIDDELNNHFVEISSPDISSLLGVSFYGSEFSERFCVHCFKEMEFAYYKSEWDYPWIHHCLKHGFPLVSCCRQCNIKRINGEKSWQMSWMACNTCLAVEQEWSDPVYRPKYYVQKISPILQEIISLFEKKPVSNANRHKLRKLAALQECVAEDRRYYSQFNYYKLAQLKLYPLDYLTSKVIVYDRACNKIDGLSPDQALACAWDILQDMPHVIPKMAKWHSLYSHDTIEILLE